MDVMTLKCYGAFGCLQYFGPANSIVIMNRVTDHLLLKCYVVEILCSWMWLKCFGPFSVWTIYFRPANRGLLCDLCFLDGCQDGQTLLCEDWLVFEPVHNIYICVFLLPYYQWLCNLCSSWSHFVHHHWKLHITFELEQYPIVVLAVHQLTNN